MNLNELSVEQLIQLRSQVAGSAAAPAEEVDTRSGAGFLDRVGASFKSTAEEKRQFYASRYGEARIDPRSGEVQFRRPGEQKWTQADERGFGMGDVADFVGDIPEVIGGIAGAAVGAVGGVGAGSVPGAAAGTALGNVVKQGVGALLPGGSDRGVGARAGEAGIAGALGGVGQGLANFIFGRLPRSQIAQQAATAARREPGFAATGAAAEDAINATAFPNGVPGGAGAPRQFQLTPYQLTGGDRVGGSEDLARMLPWGKERFSELYRSNVQTADRAITNLMDRVSTEGADPLAIGGRMRQLMERYEDDLFRFRDAQAASDFAAINSRFGNIPIAPANSLRNTLLQIAETDTLSSGQQGARALAAAREWDSLPEQLTARDIQTLLRRYGSIGYGKGDKGFFAELGDSDRVKIAKQMFAALQDDLERAASGMGGDPTSTVLSRVLRSARDNYAEASRAMEELRDSALSRVIGQTDGARLEEIPARIWRLGENQIREIVGLVDATSPELGDQIRRYAIQNAYEQALGAAERGAKGAGRFDFDVATFNAKTPVMAKLEAAFAGSGREAELRDLRGIVNGLQRLQMRAADGMSPTAARTAMLGIAKGAVNPLRWPDVAAAVLVPSRLAYWSTSPAGREALREVLAQTNRQQPSNRALAAFNQLMALQADQPMAPPPPRIPNGQAGTAVVR